MDPVLPELKHWYTRWWGVLILVATFLCLVFFGLVAITTVSYWWQIKSGRQPVFLQEHYNKFSQNKNVSDVNQLADRAQIETTDDPFLGRAGAPVTIVAFMDFKCPNSKAAATVMKQVLQKYAYTVKYIVREFPVETLYAGSTKLSEIASCAYKQDRYWEMHDVLFLVQEELPADLTEKDIEKIALQAGVNYDKLQQCLTDETSLREPKQDYLDGVRFGTSGTPTFFVNGDKVDGVVPYNAWESYLNEVVKKNSN